VRAAVLGEHDELHAPGDDDVAAAAGRAAVFDLVLEVDEHVGLGGIVGVVDEDRAGGQQRLVVLKREVEHRVEQREARAQQRRRRRVRNAELVRLESNPLVGLDDRDARADRTVAIADAHGDVLDLVAARLALCGAPAEALERLVEERLDVVRLEAVGLHALHAQPDLLDVGERHHVVVQRLPCQHLLEAVADGGVDDLEELAADLLLVAVADRLDEQVLEAAVAEHFAEDVIDATAERLALLLKLLQQPPVDVALASLGGDHVPHVADLGLPDAVNAAETLLDAVGVPRQVVVDQQMRAGG
jgi:hypothetical protein